MMISDLSAIANAKGLEFFYGETSAFNVEAEHTKAGKDLIVLYHEGYIEGPVKEDQQGAFEPSYALKLYILLPSDVTDRPLHRRPGYERLEPLMQSVLGKLRKDYKLENIFMREVMNATTRGLDGIRFTLNATPKILNLEC